jgi:CRP-like cAMP-binding protein
MLLENETLRGDALQALVQVAERMNVRDPGKALNVLDGEVSDYFATLGVLVHLPEGEEALLLRTALEERLVAVQRRVLACLKLIYGPSIISTAELCLWSASQDMRARGMEVLDNVLDDAHKADVLTAFDDIEPARKMAYAAGRFSLSDPSPQSFLGELFGSGWGRYSPWVKVVCVRTAPSLALALSAERLAEILLTNDTDVVREECLHALARQGPAMARGLLDQIACEPDSSLGAAVRRYRSGEGPMLSTLDKVLFLKSVPLFSHVQDEHLVELALKAKEVFFPNASPILRRGEMGDFMYVIISGAVCIHIGEERLAEFRKGGVFGEMAILDAEPRAADVTALEDTELLRIGQKDLLNAMTSEVEISRGVIKELSQRIRHMNDANSFRDALRRAWKAGMTPEEEAEFLEARRTGTRISAAEAAQLAAEVKEDLGIGAR